MSPAHALRAAGRDDAWIEAFYAALRAAQRCGRDMKIDANPKVPPGRYLCGCGYAIQIMDLFVGICVVPRRFGRICGLKAEVTKPIPLCPLHITDLLERPHVLTKERVTQALERFENEEAPKRADRERRRARMARLERERAEQLKRQSVVYYIRRETRIKIGTTTNMQARMTQLQPDEILATEPGGRALETRRHRQFKHLRYRGEWFTPGDDLLEHIASTRAKHGEPVITSYVPLEAAS